MSSYSSTAVNSAVMLALQATNLTSDNDTSFISRAYNGGDLDKYRARIRAIGFVDHNRVLDAGCGFGQWSVALSEVNARVMGTDIDPTRIEVATNISRTLGITNIDYSAIEMGRDEIRSGDFDAIFSYNALALSPFRQTIKDFYRILRTGGYLYFNAYDLGWMIHNILEIHNPANDFDPRQWGIDSIFHTLNYLGGRGFSSRSPRDSMLIPQELVKTDLLAMGFEILSICGDGMTSTFGEHGQQPFFPGNKYGLPAVYEVLCQKL